MNQKGKAVEIDLQYEIKNVGNIAAKNVSLPEKLVVGPKMNLREGASIIFQKTGKVTLGPGEDFIVTIQMKIEYDNIEDARKNQEHFISDKSKGTLFQLSVNYTNELDEAQKYRTFMMNRIHNDTAQVIKSEMFMITEDEAQKDITKP